MCGNDLNPADVKRKKKCKVIYRDVLHTSSSVVSAHDRNDESIERKLLMTPKGRQDRSLYISFFIPHPLLVSMQRAFFSIFFGTLSSSFYRLHAQA